MYIFLLYFSTAGKSFFHYLFKQRIFYSIFIAFVIKKRKKIIFEFEI